MESNLNTTTETPLLMQTVSSATFETMHTGHEQPANCPILIQSALHLCQICETAAFVCLTEMTKPGSET